MKNMTFLLPRRPLLALAPLLLPLAARAQGAPLGTPAQREGPYYPTAIPEDADADLRRVIGASREARGLPLLLEGIVRNLAGSPLPGARLEIWQADSSGIYLHPRDRLAQRDAGFQGYGRATADANGRYAFRTIRPGPYPGRTAHIHMRIHPPGGGSPLTTQIYFPDEPGNERDRLLRRVAEPRRALLVARLEPMDAGQRALFDVILA